MAFSITLADARAELIHLAGIDGQTGSNGRHSTTRLNTMLNRKYRMLCSRVSQLGLPQFLESGSATAIPATLAGENYIEIAIPALASEIVGVDVKADTDWGKLDVLSFSQRREGGIPFENRNYMRGLVPPSGIGFWMVTKAPKTVAATSITAGAIGIWPSNLTGSYKLHYVSSWTAITDDTHVFMLYEAWDEWFINAAVMSVCQRDKNKADLYVQARDAFAAADALLVQQSARLQRGGVVTKSDYRGGFSL